MFYLSKNKLILNYNAPQGQNSLQNYCLRHNFYRLIYLYLAMLLVCSLDKLTQSNLMFGFGQSFLMFWLRVYFFQLELNLS